MISFSHITTRLTPPSFKFLNFSCNMIGFCSFRRSHENMKNQNKISADVGGGSRLLWLATFFSPSRNLLISSLRRNMTTSFSLSTSYSLSPQIVGEELKSSSSSSSFSLPSRINKKSNMRTRAHTHTHTHTHIFSKSIHFFQIFI